MLSGIALYCSRPASAQQPNLLTNPGFESPYFQQCCHTEPSFDPNAPYAEVQVANGWKAYWVEPDSSPAFKSYCDYNVEPVTCQPYHRPEFRDLGTAPERIHGGANAQKYFTFYSTHLAGLYQQVTGVIPGQTYRFTIYVQAWSTDSSVPGASSFGEQAMGLQMGIDPNGGTDPFSANIVWSQTYNPLDIWQQLGVDVAAKSSTITVFTRSWPRLALRHVDIYLDDASLTALGGEAGTFPTSAPLIGVTPGATTDALLNPAATPRPPTPTWPPTSTPLANGEVWYTVRSGDALVVIAFYHQTTVDEIQRLNALNSATIFVGQKLLIKHVTPQPTLTATLNVTLTPSQTPELVLLSTDTPVPISNSPDYGQLCVVAYNDANSNAINDNESPLPGVRVTLSVGNTPLESYVTADEPDHCFLQLPPGTYTLSVAAPAGYAPTTTSESAVQLEAGKVITLVFGLTSATSSSLEAGGAFFGASGPLLVVGTGIMALALAGGVLLVLMARRK
ncbi:MAG: LysM peptidoglycan-binding domain-containing protein [Chloroflexi bacterium]|nr:LysM peptidoglycan-binding domain-containing protein [Chloroflexota bacterium]